MAQYSNDNANWVNDFRGTMTLMVIYGYYSSYGDSPSVDFTNFLNRVDFSITRPPTNVPSSTPIVPPTVSPTVRPSVMDFR